MASVSKIYLSVFTLYEEEFDYLLCAAEEVDPSKKNNTNWILNRMRLRIAINDARNAVLDASSITNSQAACDRGMYLVNNKSLFF